MVDALTWIQKSFPAYISTLPTFILYHCVETHTKTSQMFPLSYVDFRVGLTMPEIEVEFRNLTVGAQAVVAGRALPSFTNFYRNMFEVCSISLALGFHPLIPQPDRGVF